jgi:hypothetical protein
MLINGEAIIDETTLEKRDAVGVWEITEPVQVSFGRRSKLLAIEVPMK